MSKSKFDVDAVLTAGNVYGVRARKHPYHIDDEIQFYLTAQHGEKLEDAVNRHLNEYAVDLGDYDAVTDAKDFGAVPIKAETASRKRTETLKEEVETLSAVYSMLRDSTPGIKDKLREQFGINEADYNQPVGTRLVAASGDMRVEKGDDGKWFDVDNPDIRIDVPDEVVVAAMRGIEA